MLVCIENILPPADLQRVRTLACQARWVDGSVSAGEQSAAVKRNEQIALDSQAGLEASQIVMQAIHANPAFLSAALPVRILPPMFNRYANAQTYGAHIDNAIRATSQGAMRADISVTIFLSEPSDYEGGELTIETSFGAQAVKLSAGS
ncbi:MAG: Fe2+-dependent dioxygenase, partial [Hyphomicrobiales bacterium]|nr:Fe2+-dependent dioxygenase [Hyphomicrobiales bacterium]